MGLITKRLWAYLTALVLTAILPLTALAEGDFDYTLEQTRILMPEITVFYTGASQETDWASARVGAVLSGEPLEVLEHVPVSESLDETLYIFLVDCSTSITHPQMTGIKEALLRFSREKATNEKMMLISFGEAVSVLLEGDETPEKAAEAIESLHNDQGGTVLFDAINRAVTYFENAPDSAPPRKAAVLFTDGVDFALGSYTHYELESRLTDGSLPLYAVGFDTGTKDGLDALGALARGSGGGIYVTGYDRISGAMDAVIEKTRSAWKIVLRAATNQVSFQPELLTVQLELNGAAVSKELTVVPRRYIPDDTPPAITRVEQVAGNTLKVYFSEPVLGVDNTESFLVGDGHQEFGVVQVTYLPAENAVLLLLEQVLEDMNCTVTCLELTDRSQEKNPLTESTTSIVIGDPTRDRDKDNEPKEKIVTVEVPVYAEASRAWIPFVLIGLAGIIALIIILVRRKRADNTLPPMQNAPVYPTAHRPEPVQPPEEARHGFTARDGIPLRLIVTDRSGTAHQVDVKVSGSIFVGSSNICNLFFDDPRLAPQHFVIEAKDGMFFVQDLGSPGGTLVNGVPVRAPRKLADRDLIAAGQETFMFMSGG